MRESGGTAVISQLTCRYARALVLLLWGQMLRRFNPPTPLHAEDSKLTAEQQVGRMLGDPLVKALLFTQSSRYLTPKPTAEDVRVMEEAVRPVLQAAGQWPPELIGLVVGYTVPVRTFRVHPIAGTLTARLAEELSAEWVNRVRSSAGRSPAPPVSGARDAMADAEGCGVAVGLYPGSRLNHLLWKAFVHVPPPPAQSSSAAGPARG